MNLVLWAERIWRTSPQKFLLESLSEVFQLSLVNITTAHFDLFSLQIPIVFCNGLLVDILPKTSSYRTILYTNLAIYCQVQSNLPNRHGGGLLEKFELAGFILVI